jgi:hypothetical protein
MKTLENLKIIRQGRNSSDEFYFQSWDEGKIIDRNSLLEVFPEPISISHKEIKYYLEKKFNKGFIINERFIPENANSIIVSQDEFYETVRGLVVYPAVYAKFDF